MNDMQVNTYKEFVSLLDNMQSNQDAKAILKKLDDFKVLLEMADEFRENSIKYAMMEASVLIRIIDLGMTKELKGNRRKTAEWLCGLSESEQNEYIEMCKDGMTIDAIWRREVGDKEAEAKIIDEVRDCNKDAIIELKREGIVDLTEYDDFASRRLQYRRDIYNDFQNGLRSRIRQAGGVGVGNSSSIYVMVKPENSDAIVDAIKQRFESAANDLLRIKEIAEASEIKISYLDLVSKKDLWCHAKRDRLKVHMLIGLDAAGIIKDYDEMLTKHMYADYVENYSNLPPEIEHIYSANPKGELLGIIKRADALIKKIENAPDELKNEVDAIRQWAKENIGEDNE